MRIERAQILGAGLTVYLRESEPVMPLTATRPLVLVVPGGGYEHISPREGDPIAMQFLAAGYHAAVLQYGVGEDAQNLKPLRQINAALSLIRQRAAEWNVRPDAIAVCGFSAGGHLALSSAVLPLPSEEEQQRPNALILCYPVVTAGQYAHRSSFVKLTGSEDAALHAPYSLENRIGPDTPPVFVWHSMQDATVPVENTLLLISALRRAGVSCEAHLFPTGKHGTSLCTAEVNCPLPHSAHWMALALEWLGEQFDYRV